MAEDAAGSLEGDVGGLLKSKGRAGGEEGGRGREGGKDVTKLLEKAFGGESEEDRFLRRFILNKGWVEEGADEEEEARLQPLDEDEGELERQDAFEYRYNFRFEDPEGARLQTFPRRIEGAVRKEESSRKRQREARAQRKEEEKKREAEEVKRLKNLKRREIEERLEEMQAIAGPGAPANESVLSQLLEGDFDPEAWDRHMASAFGEEYYGMDEEDLGAMAEEDAPGEEDEEDQDGGPPPSKRPRPDAPEPEDLARQRDELQRLLGEYHGLDYEDNIGGLKTRFRYKQVEAQDYGLSVLDILELDDKELNRLVGLKRLAPYREDQGRLPSRQAKKMQYQLERVKREKGHVGEGRKGKGQEQGTAGGKGAERKEEEGGKARLSTYAKPTLDKGEKEKGEGERKKERKEKKEAAAPPPGAVQYPAGLTKAQKKNFKRSLKRKEGKDTGAEKE